MTLQNPLTNYEECFRGDLEVKNVHFKEIVKDGVNFQNDIEKSTIIKGELRMGEKVLKIKSNQFIMTGKSGIQRLRNIEIFHPKKITEVQLRIAGEELEVSGAMAGLEVRIAGKIDGIQVGLDRLFLVSRLQSNLLAN
ncbi:hypothetical protein [Scytonema sp. NUACC26]|uniref:hypothetical protein n=1 Tax=Scytonema sp. NUACC26 TaxID=3140176 RepID=UPI0034DB8437